MAKYRVALIFDDTSRPETTGVYCRTALQGIVQVEHYRPADLERLPTLLGRRGYKEEAIQAILYTNWLRFFRDAWR